MTTSRSRHAVAAIALLVLGASGPGAQTRRPMSLVDLAEVPRLVDVQLSPDGRSVLYTLNRADWKANRPVGHLWRQEVAGGAPSPLTFGDAGEGFGRWSPDGRTILFLRGGQVWLLPADGGESRQLTRHATNVSSPAWTPDAAAIYFLASDVGSPDERERDRLRDDVVAFEENYKQRHLWKAVVASGAEQRVSEGDFSVVSYRLSRDGKRIALHRGPTPLLADLVRAEVWTMDASGDRATMLTRNAIDESDAELSPDNSQLLFLAGANDRFEPYYSNTIFVMPAGGGAARRLLRDFPHWVERASWAPDGQSILAVVNMGVHSEVFQIDLDGRPKQMTDGQHSVQFWSLAPAAGRMVFQFDEPARLGDAWTLPIAGGPPARVTAVYDAFERDFRLPRQEQIQWNGADGATIEGLLFYPLDYDAGKRYPLVVQLHGGPRESDKFGAGPGFLVNYFPVLAAKGYAVLRPNYRGSTGYGDAFLRDVVGAYFRNMHLDVLAGVDALVARGLADPDRLAVMGWSAGGHLTNKLITFTDRFKAASSGAGAANWTSMYAQSDQRADRTVVFGGTPWQKNAPIDTYWNNSPLKDIANVKTPTLFIVGDDDARVPKQQSIEMYRALKANGVATKLYIAPREPHQWNELRHQLSKANVELEWFERYVMGRPYTPERPPGDAPTKPGTQ